MIIALLYSLANEKRIVVNAINKLVRITGLPKKEVSENLVVIHEKINLKSLTNSESGRKADLKLPTKGQLYQLLNHKEKELLSAIKDGKITTWKSPHRVNKDIFVTELFQRHFSIIQSHPYRKIIIWIFSQGF